MMADPTPAPAVQTQLAALAADLKTLIANAEAATTAKKAELHNLVVVAEADLEAAKVVLGEFLPRIKADVKAVVGGAEAVVMAPVNVVKEGAVKMWPAIAALAGGMGVGGLIWAAVHFI